MPVNCCCCGSGGGATQLFNFPKNEPFRSEWIKFAGVEENSRKFLKLCSRHFSEELLRKKKDQKSTTSKKSRIYLPRTAVPTIKYNENPTNSSIEGSAESYTCLQCKTTSNSLHFKFPKNLQRRNEWLRRCGYSPDFHNGDKEWYLCASHFAENMIIRKKTVNGRNKLRPSALPLMTDYSSELVYSNETVASDTNDNNEDYCNELVNSNNVTVAWSINSDDDMNIESSSPRTLTRKRSIRYVGDISSPDFASPERARQSVLFMKSEVIKYRRKIDILKKKNRRLEATVKKYQNLISHLKNKDLLSENAYAALCEGFDLWNTFV